MASSRRMCINTVFGAKPGYTGRKSEKQQSTMSSTGQQALQNRQTWPQIAAVPPAVLTCMRMPCRTHAGVTSETEIQSTITLCQAVQTWPQVAAVPPAVVTCMRMRRTRAQATGKPENQFCTIMCKQTGRYMQRMQASREQYVSRQKGSASWVATSHTVCRKGCGAQW